MGINLKQLLIPGFLRRKIDSREGMQKMTQNFTWLLMDKILKMTVLMAINIWAYRYLGPEQVGIWNYAIAFVSIFMPIANLGIDAIVVRDIVNNPVKKNELIGASFFLKFFGSLLMTFVCLTIIKLRRPEDAEMFYYVFILSAAYIFLAFDAIDLYNQSQLKSKYTVLSKSIGYLICAVLKVILILKGMSLEWFVWMQFIENAIGAVFLVFWYQMRGERILLWKPDFKIGLNLIKQSWPLIITSLLMFMQHNIDQIFLGDWISDFELGQFSTAAKLIIMFGFIPMIIQSTVAPEIAKAKKISDELYYLKLKKVYQIMFVISITIILICFLFGKQLIVFLYGPEYEKAGMLMGLMSVRLIFINYGVTRTLFITNNNLFKYYMLTALAGAVINVSLNYFIIPIYASSGAVWVSIISLSVSVIFIDFFYKGARRNFAIMASSFVNLGDYFKKIK